jgi:hypothetical protein
LSPDGFWHYFSSANLADRVILEQWLEETIDQSLYITIKGPKVCVDQWGIPQIQGDIKAKEDFFDIGDQTDGTGTSYSWL